MDRKTPARNTSMFYSGVRSHEINAVMPGEREARGKGIHSVKKTLDLEMDSLSLAAYRRSPGMTRVSMFR